MARLEPLTAHLKPRLAWYLSFIAALGLAAAGQAQTPLKAKPKSLNSKASVALAKTSSQVAQLGAGCFWGVEEYFRKIPGVQSVRVGYEGGQNPAPNYAAVSAGKSGHAETAEIRFDPEQISYEQLLTHFFKMHDPTTLNRQGNDKGTQYRSVIFVQSPAQKKTAEQLIGKIERSRAWKSKVVTQIENATTFFPAEEYHQKYLVKHPGGYDNHFVRDLSF